MAWREVVHPDAEALAAAVAARLDGALDEALAARGRATLVLAGGRTSPPVFRRLAARARDWSRVTAVPSDERWVDAAHPDCNLAQLGAAFAAAPGLRLVPLVPERPAGEPDARFARAALAPLAGPFDATLLGMGADGHFASLFPGAPTLAGALDPACRDAAVAIVPDPMPAAGPHPRVSLTLARLIDSRLVLLAITGADKRATLARAAAGDAALPVAALLAAPGAAIEVHWSP